MKRLCDLTHKEKELLREHLETKMNCADANAYVAGYYCSLETSVGFLVQAFGYGPYISQWVEDKSLPRDWFTSEELAIGPIQIVSLIDGIHEPSLEELAEYKRLHKWM